MHVGTGAIGFHFFNINFGDELKNNENGIVLVWLLFLFKINQLSTPNLISKPIILKSLIYNNMVFKLWILFLFNHQ